MQKISLLSAILSALIGGEVIRESLLVIKGNPNYGGISVNGYYGLATAGGFILAALWLILLNHHLPVVAAAGSFFVWLGTWFLTIIGAGDFTQLTLWGILALVFMLISYRRWQLLIKIKH